MSAAWPLAPGQYLLVGLEEDPGDARVRTQVTMGRPLLRRRASGAIGGLRGQLVLTGAQLDTFRTWGKVTLQEWCLQFDWTEPGMEQPMAYQFREVPRWRLEVPSAPVGWGNRLWRVELELEALP